MSVRMFFSLAAVIAIAGASDSSAAAPFGPSAAQHDTQFRPHHRSSSKAKQRTQRALQFLNSTVAEAAYVDEPLVEVFAWFREHGLRNVVIHWSKIEATGGVSRDTPITLTLSDITYAELLIHVLDYASLLSVRSDDQLTYYLIDGILHVATRAHFQRRLVTRIYTVEDLLFTPFKNELLPFLETGQQRAYVRSIEPRVAPGAAASAPQIDVIASGSSWGPGRSSDGQPDFRAMRAEQLAQLIELIQQIHPHSWAKNGGKGTIQSFDGRLIISQTPEVHEMIGGYASGR